MNFRMVAFLFAAVFTGEVFGTQTAVVEDFKPTSTTQPGNNTHKSIPKAGCAPAFRRLRLRTFSWISAA